MGIKRSYSISIRGEASEKTPPLKRRATATYHRVTAVARVFRPGDLLVRPIIHFSKAQVPFCGITIQMVLFQVVASDHACHRFPGSSFLAAGAILVSS
jgi:hypothetical protein